VSGCRKPRCLVPHLLLAVLLARPGYAADAWKDAKALVAAGRLREATAEFTVLLGQATLREDKGDLHLALARLAHDLGDLVEAVEHYERAAWLGRPTTVGFALLELAQTAYEAGAPGRGYGTVLRYRRHRTRQPGWPAARSDLLLEAHLLEAGGGADLNRWLREHYGAPRRSIPRGWEDPELRAVREAQDDVCHDLLLKHVEALQERRAGQLAGQCLATGRDLPPDVEGDAYLETEYWADEAPRTWAPLAACREPHDGPTELPDVAEDQALLYELVATGAELATLQREYLD